MNTVQGRLAVSTPKVEGDSWNGTLSISGEFHAGITQMQFDRMRNAIASFDTWHKQSTCICARRTAGFGATICPQE